MWSGMKTERAREKWILHFYYNMETREHTALITSLFPSNTYFRWSHLAFQSDSPLIQDKTEQLKVKGAAEGRSSGRAWWCWDNAHPSDQHILQAWLHAQDSASFYFPVDLHSCVLMCRFKISMNADGWKLKYRDGKRKDMKCSGRKKDNDFIS